MLIYPLDISNNYCVTGILPVQDWLFGKCLLHNLNTLSVGDISFDPGKKSDRLSIKADCDRPQVKLKGDRS